MALMKCSECGKEISDQAQSCPNCGYPIPHFVEIELKISSKSYKSQENKHTFVISLDKNERQDITSYAGYFKPGIAVELKSKCGDSLGEFEAAGAYFLDSWSKIISLVFNELDGEVSENAEYVAFRFPKSENESRCPKCGSSNIKKIGVAHKAASAWALGVLSAKTLTSQYQCLKCGHKF